MTRPSLYARSELAARRHDPKWSTAFKRAIARLEFAAGYRTGVIAERRERARREKLLKAADAHGRNAGGIGNVDIAMADLRRHLERKP